MIPNKNNGEGLIYRHVVAPEHRRQGIGSQLLEYTQRWALERKLRSLAVSLHTKNYPAIEFYRSHGFSFCGFSEQTYNNQQIVLHFSRSVR